MGFANEILPNSGDRHQGRVAWLNDRVIPREFLGPIFEKAKEASLVMRLGRKHTLSYGENIISISGSKPEVGQVGVGTKIAEREGYDTPVSGWSWDIAAFSPVAMGTIVTASEKFEEANLEDTCKELEVELAEAIGRGIDLAVFHNLTANAGKPWLGTELNSFINASTKRVYAGADPATNLRQDIVAAWKMVTKERLNVNGIAIDPLFHPDVVGAEDSQGRPLFGQGALDLSGKTGNVLGLRAEIGSAVSGAIGVNMATSVGAIVGDWSRCLWGFADQITIKKATEASLPDGKGGYINLFTSGQIAFKVNATVGWKVDPKAFAVVETGAGPTPAPAPAPAPTKP